MKELVKYLAKAIVDKPEEVIVTETEGDKTSIIKLRVDNRGFITFCLGDYNFFGFVYNRKKGQER